jgi:hypothetical protein
MSKEHIAAIFRIEVSGVRLKSDYKAHCLGSMGGGLSPVQANREYKSTKSVIMDWNIYAVGERITCETGWSNRNEE